MAHKVHRGERIRQEDPDKEFVSIPERKKNGNRDGITVLIQRSIPCLAPDNAVFPSRIRISNPAREAAQNMVRFDFKMVTSEESMQDGLVGFIESS
jgi:hypothetical protein